MRRQRCKKKRRCEGRRVKKKRSWGWAEAEKSPPVRNHRHITGTGGEAVGWREEQVCVWVADKRHSITYASLEREHQSGAGWAARAVCLCASVSVCVIRSLLCATDSPQPLHFIPLLPVCWNTLFLSFVNFSAYTRTQTRGFSLLSHHFEPFPGLADWNITCI